LIAASAVATRDEEELALAQRQSFGTPFAYALGSLLEEKPVDSFRYRNRNPFSLESRWDRRAAIAMRQATVGLFGET